MKKLLLFLFLILGLSSSYAALPASLNFATEATYPPFEFVDPSGAIKGFDIDIAQALCQKMAVKCNFVNQPWDSLIPGLKLGKFNALIGAMEITPARKNQVDFTEAYLPATGLFIAEKNSSLSISAAGLKDKTIGVQGGTTFEQYLTKEYGRQIKIKSYNSMQDALLDLDAGRVDAVLGDSALLLDWLKKHDPSDHLKQVGQPFSNPSYFGQGYGIAVQKGNSELLNALNQALQEIKQDGSYQKILNHYFPPNQ